jgi:hypothetical protein
MLFYFQICHDSWRGELRIVFWAVWLFLLTLHVLNLYLKRTISEVYTSDISYCSLYFSLSGLGDSLFVSRKASFGIHTYGKMKS